jgi:hypothetical protein
VARVKRYIPKEKARKTIEVLSVTVSELALKQRRNVADCINANFQGNFEHRRLYHQILVDNANIANAVSAYVNEISGMRVSRFESALKAPPEFASNWWFTAQFQSMWKERTRSRRPWPVLG